MLPLYCSLPHLGSLSLLSSIALVDWLDSAEFGLFLRSSLWALIALFSFFLLRFRR